MKSGDTVTHKEEKNLGKGKIVSFKSFHGTVLVKWDKIQQYRYHIPRSLKIEESS